MNLAISPLPSKWDVLTTGTGAVNKNTDGSVKIIDNDTTSTAYIYKCVQVSAGDTITVSALVNVNSGSLSIITSEMYWGASDFNQQRTSRQGLHEISIAHTVKLDSNEGKYIFIKIGCTGADTADADVLWCKVDIEKSSVGSLRDVAYGYITLNNGTVELNNSFANSGIASMNLTTQGLEIEFDNVLLLTRVESTHNGILPLITAHNVFTPNTHYEPRVVSYEPSTRKALIRFWSLSGGSYTPDAKAIESRVIVRASIV
ncbi:hypothetical protein AB7185_07175 [Providencia rettgeri]